MIISKNIIDDLAIEDIICDFIRIDTSLSKLPVDVFCDEFNIKENTYFPNIIFFRNSYNKDSDDYMPVLVSETPILLSRKPLNIFQKDCNLIFDWIVKYRDIIVALSEEKIDNTTFFQYLGHLRSSKFGWSDKITENASYSYVIYEMARLNSIESGLKYDLWLDDNFLYKKGGHSYRIKIQPKSGNKNTRSWNELTLTGVWIGDSDKDYSSKERKSIVEFMNNNKQLIMDLSDKKITFAYFKEHLIKYSPKKTSDIDEYKDDDFKIVYSFDNGFDMIVNQDYNYNILDENGEVLSDDWYLFIDFRVYKEKNKEYFVCTNKQGVKYKLYTDKRFIKI